MKHTVVICVSFILLISMISVGYCGTVSLEWRPGYQIVRTGDSVTLRLYAASDDGANHAISGLDAIMLYDPAYLAFQNIIPNTGLNYRWLVDGFFSPSPDNLNNSLDDGNMMYSAWARLGEPAVASVSGLLVTSLVFDAQSEVCRTLVRIPATFGAASSTRIFDGSIPNFDVKGSLGSARVMVVGPTVAMSVVEAKAKTIGVTFDLAGPIVTRSFPSQNYFYIEDYNRVAGIKVNCASGMVPAQGSTPFISGSVQTVDGEMVIDAVDVTVGSDCIPEEVPRPLGANGRTAYGDALTCGLLVRVWGIAKSVQNNPFILSDGSENGLRVELVGVPASQENDYIAVTGVLSRDSSGPVLRVNSADDVTLIHR